MSQDPESIRADIEATRRRLSQNAAPEWATSRGQEERETESTAYAAPAYVESPVSSSFGSLTPSITERVTEDVVFRSLIPDSKNAEIVKRYDRWKLDSEYRQARTNAATALLTYGTIGLAILGAAVYTYFGVRDLVSSSISIGLLLLISFIFGFATVVYGLVKYLQTLHLFRLHRERQEAQARFEQELSAQALASLEPEAVTRSASDG